VLQCVLQREMQCVVVCVCDVGGARVWAVCHITIASMLQCLLCISKVSMVTVCHISIAAAGSRCLGRVAVCVAV